MGGRRRLFDADIKDEAAQGFDFIEEPIREAPELSIPQDISHRVEAAPLLLPEGECFSDCRISISRS